MQHSQLRKPNEKVKLFAKTPTGGNQSLSVHEYVNGVIVDITPTYSIESLNTGYFSTEIITPDHSSYLLIMFNGNPIVLRVGEPTLQFFFWAPKQKTYAYSHFDEFGAKLDEGLLKALGLGFYYSTPVSDSLGYIEVLNKPYVLHVPYCSGSVGVGIDVDWRRTIKRQLFGLSTTKLNFTLNNKKLLFGINTESLKFSLKVRNQMYSKKVIKQTFNVKCSGGN